MALGCLAALSTVYTQAVSDNKGLGWYNPYRGVEVVITKLKTDIHFEKFVEGC